MINVVIVIIIIAIIAIIIIIIFTIIPNDNGSPFLWLDGDCHPLKNVCRTIDADDYH